MSDATLLRVVMSAIVFAGAALLGVYGLGPLRVWLTSQERAYDAALRRRLMLDVDGRTFLAGCGVATLVALAVGYALSGGLWLGVVFAAVVFFLPNALIRHLAHKRRQRLDEQLVDGLNTLASGARAGMNLVHCIDLLIQNHRGPIQQEFAQIRREYELGRDLDRAMQHASDRIGSQLYRLTFTAVETHRRLGGNSAESLDRIADSVREIQRLEGKLDALTAQGRTQAVMMAVMPIVFLAILYLIDRGGVALLFTDPIGRVILLVVAAMIALAFLWIRKILAVDI